MKKDQLTIKAAAALAVMALLIVFCGAAYSQDGVRIAASAGTADPSALLDVVSTAKGVLIPRMTSGQRGSIASPATGLLVFQTDGTPGFYYNAGSPGTPNWVVLSAGALSGLGSANSVARWTGSSTLGTGVLSDNGTNVGVGAIGPSQKLHVGAGNNDGILIGNYNDQLGWSGGGTAPQYSIRFAGYRDVVGNFTGAKIAAIRTNICCSALSQGTELAFFTQEGTATVSGDGNLTERLRIGNGGNVGIGTSTPTERLDLNGKLKFTSNGSTMSRAPRVIHTEDPRGGCPGGYAVGTDMFSHTFTVNNTASVYLSGQIIRHVSGRADLYLMLNGGQVDQSLSWTSSAQWDDMTVQWSGVIGPGTYTVSLRGNIANIWGCGTSWGSIDSIIFEH